MEQPLDTFRSSTWGWLRGTLAGWATMALVPLGILLTAPGEWGRWPMLISALAFLILLWKWLENMASRYDICPDRLIVARGIFMKSLDEVELYRVKDIRLDFSLINQMAGIGSITLVSSDETTRAEPLRLRHVERAAERR
ncbi:MAG TPA: PH domain-containing protein, partial [Allosphingosinicella sp.]|nr:PH domain-containing protein [Allosphingosinicella sp.]